MACQDCKKTRAQLLADIAAGKPIKAVKTAAKGARHMFLSETRASDRRHQ